jgi:hypothetical protein
VVESYSVRGTRFPSHLLLEGTGLYADFWAITEGPRYLGYKTLTILPIKNSGKEKSGKMRSSLIDIASLKTFMRNHLGKTQKVKRVSSYIEIDYCLGVDQPKPCNTL